MNKKNIFFGLGVIILLLFLLFILLQKRSSLNLDMTQDWQSYTSEVFGIEFKYPRNWEIEEGSTMGGVAKTVNVFEKSNIQNSIIFGGRTACEDDLIKKQATCVMLGTNKPVIYTYSNEKGVLSVFDLIVKSVVSIKKDSVDTSVWQVYKNNNYGFEFKLPADLKEVDVEIEKNSLISWVSTNSDSEIRVSVSKPISFPVKTHEGLVVNNFSDLAKIENKAVEQIGGLNVFMDLGKSEYAPSIFIDIGDSKYVFIDVYDFSNKEIHDLVFRSLKKSK